MAIFDKEHSPPQPDVVDAGYSVVRAALGGIPVVGSAAQELLQAIIAPPLVRRQAEWAEDVGRAIRRLEAEKGIRPEDLRDNAAFIDARLVSHTGRCQDKPGRKEKGASEYDHQCCIANGA